MNRWLLKTEPNDYSISDLERDGDTRWDGVANNAALKNMRDVRKGDSAFIYHTGKDKHIAGIATVTTDAYEHDGLIVFDVAFRSRLKHPPTLAMVKAEPDLAGWELVKQARLSVMPVTREQWDWVVKAAR
jgi:predicted RNA-binding protein with PUA-like domain